MDENLEVTGDDSFVYHIKTNHTYGAKVKVKDNVIKVSIFNFYKDREVKTMKFESKMLGKMSSEQVTEYVLDCFCLFDRRIEEFNQGNIKL